MNKLIAVVGMAGSGKSIATDYLKENGWTKIYFGGAVYDRMRKEGIEITPESQKEYRENLRKLKKKYLQKIIKKKMKRKKVQRIMRKKKIKQL